MNQKKLKKTICKLAEMCNATVCKNCFLSFNENKCMLKHASLPDIAKGCFDKEQRYEGTIWVRFKNKEDFSHACNDIRELLKTEGNYEVRIYLMDTNEMQIQALMADEEIFTQLIEDYGEDNVKLVAKVPDEVLSYF